jgi:hypothetical protein
VVGELGECVLGPGVGPLDVFAGQGGLRALIGRAGGEDVVTEVAVEAKPLSECGVGVVMAAHVEKRYTEVEMRGGQLPARTQPLAYLDTLAEGVEGVSVATLTGGDEALEGERVTHVYRVIAVIGEADGFGGQLGQPSIVALGESQAGRGAQRLGAKGSRRSSGHA